MRKESNQKQRNSALESNSHSHVEKKRVVVKKKNIGHIIRDNSLLSVRKYPQIFVCERRTPRASLEENNEL